MKLLIVTQTIDIHDPILGFFVRWTEEFAKNCEAVEVCALNVGEHNLPQNVTVHCLGKSEGKSKIIWLWRLWKLSWSRRKQYDTVFVHMNPEYVLYGSGVWKLLNKTIGFWYAHGAVSFRLRVASWLSRYIFTSTEQGYRFESAKRKIVGQGIDTDIFTPPTNETRTIDKTESVQLVTVGRVSISKRLETLVHAVKLLLDDGQDATLDIVGVPITADDKKYQEQLMQLIKQQGLEQAITFVGSLDQKALAPYVADHHIFIQNGNTGSLDKVLLESLASGVPTVSSNESYRSLVLPVQPQFSYPLDDQAALASSVTAIIGDYKTYLHSADQLREKIQTDHSIGGLISHILSHYQTD